MIRMLWFLVCICSGLKLKAQQGAAKESKPAIDTGVLGKWPFITGTKVSTYGRFVGYWIMHPASHEKDLVLQDSSMKWKCEFKNALDFVFSDDEREVVIYRGDSLYFIALGKRKESRSFEVKSMQSPGRGDGEWLGYEEKKGAGELVLVNLLSGLESRLGKVLRYGFDPAGKCLLVLRESPNNTDGEQLYYRNLSDQTEHRIWEANGSEKLGRWWFSKTGRLLGFIVMTQSEGRFMKKLWAYLPGADRAELSVAEGDPRLGDGASIGDDLTFSGDGRWLFFSAQVRRKVIATEIPSDDAVMVDVWGYKDLVIQPEQMVREGLDRSGAEVGRVHYDISMLMGAVKLDGKILRIVTQGAERLETAAEDVTSDEVVISEQDSTARNPLGGIYSFLKTYWLMSLVDGCRQYIQKDALELGAFTFSPDGQWLVFFDAKKEQFISYEVKTGRLRDITGKLPVPVTVFRDGEVTYFPAISSAGGWWEREGRQRVLIYDRYDLWGLDPANRLPPINISKSYGKQNGVGLRLMGAGAPWAKRLYSNGDTLMFVGFNPKTKYNGFVRVVLGNSNRPEELTMGPYLYCRLDYQNPPVRAAHVDYWVLSRQTASEAPNYFLTSDWRHLRPLSHLQPQKDYNWLTSELVEWRQLDGTTDQGILYKPENFDPGKRYPVIIHYYHQLSDRLYEFLPPNFMMGSIDIPWMVSHGYLVLTPDIHYQTASVSGKVAGWWAYNAVVSAAKYLSNLSYVDPRRLGLQGFSFGGLETNYIITHSSLFAAAAEVSGPTDMINSYLSLTFGRSSSPIEHDDIQDFIETGSPRMGATLWQRPELYLESSAVLGAGRVTTPLLMVHNKKDQIVPWRQGVEMYLALRRLGKRAWLLQYDEGAHGIYGKATRDYTIRLTQFFNHYLKGEDPPKWMTQGIPARLKGIVTGYELDRSGKAP